MEKYCKSCGSVFNNLKFKLCPYCGGELDTRYGRQPIPRKLRHEVFKRDGYRCRECGSSKDETSLEIDHIIPVARGGTNDIHNLQTLCRECNRMKHTDEWAGGETDLEVAQNELSNLKSLLQETEEKLYDCGSEDEELEYEYKIVRLSESIEEVEKKINNLEEKERMAKEQQIEEERKDKLFKKLYVELEGELLLEVFNHFSLTNSSKEDNLRQLVDKYAEQQIYDFKEELEEKNKLFKELYVELDDKILSKVFNYFKLNELSNEDNLRLLVNKYSKSEILKVVSLFQIEYLNTTTEGIYDLGDYEVIIILKDGTNLTSWNHVSNKNDILYIIENLSNYTDLSHKYENLKSLRTIITLGTTNQVTNMDEMFYGCESLVDISALANWDVSNVIKMNGMFDDCKSLVDISSISNWDISKVDEVGSMFSGCESLVDLSPLSDWDVSNVTWMYALFSGCESLKNISALANWKIQKINQLGPMFGNCKSLEDISALANWDISKVDEMAEMFGGCSSLVDLSPLSDWDVSNVTNMQWMFDGCFSLIDLSPLSDWDVSSVTTMARMFHGCSHLIDLSPLSRWDVSNVIDMCLMFADCSNLVDLSPLSDWDMSNTKINEKKWGEDFGMFSKCKSLGDASVLSSWNLSNLENIEGVFDECPNLEKYPSWYKKTS